MFVRMGSHVVLIRYTVRLSLFIQVAVILSSVSLLLMACSHRLSTSVSVWSVRFMAFSHLRTQIKCADSEIIICRSLFCPECDTLSAGVAFAPCVSCGVARLPHPRMDPMSTSGHWLAGWGHQFLARFQMMFTGRAGHSRRMWLMVSVAWQVLHHCL